LRQLLELREALTALKGPLGNVPAFKRAIEAALTDEEARKKLLAELGGKPE
jgi:type VI secretion system protein ImpB